MITIFFGKSASGKDTFMKQYVAKGFKPIVSYTTRPMREGEVDGVDYHFVDKATFDKYVSKGVIFETRSYKTLVNGKQDTWYYGSPSLNAKSDDYVGVLDINGIKSYLRYYGAKDIALVYVMVADDELRKRRAMGRGGFDESEWNRRLADDNIKFSADALEKLSLYYRRPIMVIRNDGNSIDDVKFELLEEGRYNNMPLKKNKDTSYRKYYTLKRGNFPDEEEYSEDGKTVAFDSYEEAYDKMCRIYMDSLSASYDNPSGLPIRYSIYRTTSYNGNSMTQPVTGP